MLFCGEKIVFDFTQLRAVVFDMDGLMFDTERISIPAWQEAGKEFGYQIPVKLIISTIGVSSRQTEVIHKNYFGPRYPFNEINEKKKENLKKIIKEKGMPFKKGLPEILEVIKRFKLKSAIATSSSRPIVDFYLQQAGLASQFKLVICGNEIEEAKPKPDIYLKALQLLGCQTTECLGLEDSANGIKAAAQARVKVIYIPDLDKVEPSVQRLALFKAKSLDQVARWLKINLLKSLN